MTNKIMQQVVQRVFPQPTIPLGRNPILEADSYKLSHPSLYPKGIHGMHSNIVARSKGDIITFFGLQQYLKSRFLSCRVTMEHIAEAEAFAEAHGEPFNRKAWEKVVNVYGGYVPLTIKAVPEGTRVPSGNVVMTIECRDPDLYWMPSNRETSLLRGVWYPSTIASKDLVNYRILKRYADSTCDDAGLVPFQLHDFGGRGVTCGEQAEIGGAAHLIYFMGSDTMEGIRAANYYYNCPMSAFSVVATEHTIQCAFGPLAQRDYVFDTIKMYLKPGKIVSIVIDGYNTLALAELICSDPEIMDFVKKSGGKLVMRPDSGDPAEILPALMQIQARGYGYKLNSKGYAMIGWIENHALGGCIGTLQGDGVDQQEMERLLGIITSTGPGNGWASSNIVFGSGGGLLQKVNRDTYKWAQKATAIVRGDRWYDIFKDPITDHGKKSFAGRMTLLKNSLTGEFLSIDEAHEPDGDEWTCAFQTVLDENRPGELLIDENLDPIRARALR